jgi:phage terminase Nu1 subunit (DNA packaging protein)
MTTNRTIPDFSLSQLAALLGLSTQQVGTLVKQGVVTKTSPGRYAASSITRYIATLRARTNLSGRYGEARVKKLEEQALLAETNRLARQGQLVSLEEIGEAWMVLTSNIKSSFLRLPTLATPRLQGKGPNEQFKLLTDLVRQILTELSETKYAVSEAAE